MPALRLPVQNSANTVTQTCLCPYVLNTPTLVLVAPFHIPLYSSEAIPSLLHHCLAPAGGALRVWESPISQF